MSGNEVSRSSPVVVRGGKMDVPELTTQKIPADGNSRNKGLDETGTELW